MKDLLKDKIDLLVDKAKAGDYNAQYKLAKAFYYGEKVKRSLPLANYWAYKAATNEDNYKREICDFYDVASAPHYTGNEFYESYGRYYSLNLNEYGLWGSLKLKGKYDVYKGDNRLYKKYLILRIIILFFVIGSYRVYEASSCNAYHIIGQEKARFKDYFGWLILDFAVIGIIVYYVIKQLI